MINIIDWNDPVIKKALRLSKDLNDHCQEHGPPKMLILDGVAHNSSAIWNAALESAKEEVDDGYHMALDDLRGQ